MDLDQQIRLAAFDWLKEQVIIHGDVLPRTLLETGFFFEGERIQLIAPKGIFKPRFLELPISITTAPRGPYDDSFTPEGLLLYRYRGSDPNHPDNKGLREALLRDTPLIYFHGIVPGRYLAAWPVYIVGDMPQSLTFTVAVDDEQYARLTPSQSIVAESAHARRAYLTALVRQRLHQRSFREKVLKAYQQQCALCRLRHPQLLDAAHIIPDAEETSLPVIPNGISLCKLHHAAFDTFILGITPDYKVIIRKDILEEHDGPMLQHGLKEMHGSRIILPHDRSSRPDRDLLDQRYQKFLASV